MSNPLHTVRVTLGDAKMQPPMLEVEKTRRFLREHHPDGDYTFIDLPWVNHDTAAFLRDTPERETMRRWLETVVSEQSQP